MGRKQINSEPSCYASLVLLLMGVVSCTLVCAFFFVVLRLDANSLISELDASTLIEEDGSIRMKVGSGRCYKGIENLEPGRPAVKWGFDFKFNSSKECCMDSKEMCNGNDRSFLCDTWVFYGNREVCGPKFRKVSVILKFVASFLLWFWWN